METNENIIYELEYTDTFLEDIELHKKSGQKSVLNKINNLLDELREHPTTGTGKPEPLKHNLSGFYSRRITQEHRLIYKIENKTVTVVLVAAFGHYGDK